MSIAKPSRDVGSKWCLVGSDIIINLDNIKTVSILKTGSSVSTTERSTTERYYLTINGDSIGLGFYSREKAVEVIKAISTKLAKREKYLSSIDTSLEAEIDELRQMITHMPGVGSVYLDAKNNFSQMQADALINETDARPDED